MRFLWALLSFAAAATAAAEAHAPPHDAFRRLDARDIRVAGKLRSSEQRRLRAAIQEQYPECFNALDSGELWGEYPHKSAPPAVCSPPGVVYIYAPPSPASADGVR